MISKIIETLKYFLNCAIIFKLAPFNRYKDFREVFLR